MNARFYGEEEYFPIKHKLKSGKRFKDKQRRKDHGSFRKFEKSWK